MDPSSRREGMNESLRSPGANRGVQAAGALLGGAPAESHFTRMV